MPRGSKRFFSTRPLSKLTEHHKSTKHEANPLRVDNISETSGDSISLNEKPSTSKQAVQYPSRTFENRSALEAFKTGFWKKPGGKDNDESAQTKKKTQRKPNKRAYVNFSTFNYSDPEDYADADSYSNGPAKRYVDVARAALYSRSSPTPVQKIQQRAPNLDLHEFPYLKSNKIKNSADTHELMTHEHERNCSDCSQHEICENEEIDENQTTMVNETTFDYHQQNEHENGIEADADITADEIAADMLERTVIAALQQHHHNRQKHETNNAVDGDEELNEMSPTASTAVLNEQTQQSFVVEVNSELDVVDPRVQVDKKDIDDDDDEEEQLVHPLAFHSLSPYPSSSFVYINPNMDNNFDYSIDSTSHHRHERCDSHFTSSLPATPSDEKFNFNYTLVENYATTNNNQTQQLPATTSLPSMHQQQFGVDVRKSSFIDKFGLLENESEYETTSNFGYGAGDYAASSDSCTIQHDDETTSEYIEAASINDDELQHGDGDASAGIDTNCAATAAAATACGGDCADSPFGLEWLEMMIQQLSARLSVNVPNFNFLEPHRDFPRLTHQFEDSNYLRLEERAIFGYMKSYFKDDPYI